MPGLKMARARTGLTLDGLEERAGVDRTTINQLENLRRGADLRTVFALAEALEVTVEELTGE